MGGKEILLFAIDARVPEKMGLLFFWSRIDVDALWTQSNVYPQAIYHHLAVNRYDVLW